jgi:predicted ArsR family transcriptional regulator
MVLEIAALDPKDTGARGGQEILATVFGAISAHMAQDYGTKVQGETLDERADSLTTVLKPEGIVERWERRDDGIHLLTTVCPHRRAAQASSALCNAEARTLSTLLGCEVEQVARLVDGASCCEFVARGEDATAEDE